MRLVIVLATVLLTFHVALTALAAKQGRYYLKKLGKQLLSPNEKKESVPPKQLERHASLRKRNFKELSKEEQVIKHVMLRGHHTLKTDVPVRKHQSLHSQILETKTVEDLTKEDRDLNKKVSRHDHALKHSRSKHGEEKLSAIADFDEVFSEDDATSRHEIKGGGSIDDAKGTESDLESVEPVAEDSDEPEGEVAKHETAGNHGVDHFIEAKTKTEEEEEEDDVPGHTADEEGKITQGGDITDEDEERKITQGSDTTDDDEAGKKQEDKGEHALQASQSPEEEGDEEDEEKGEEDDDEKPSHEDKDEEEQELQPTKTPQYTGQESAAPQLSDEMLPEMLHKQNPSYESKASQLEATIQRERLQELKKQREMNRVAELAKLSAQMKQQMFQKLLLRYSYGNRVGLSTNLLPGYHFQRPVGSPEVPVNVPMFANPTMGIIRPVAPAYVYHSPTAGLRAQTADPGYSINVDGLRGVFTKSSGMVLRFQSPDSDVTVVKKKNQVKPAE